MNAAILSNQASENCFWHLMQPRPQSKLPAQPKAYAPESAMRTSEAHAVPLRHCIGVTTPNGKNCTRTSKFRGAMSRESADVSANGVQEKGYQINKQLEKTRSNQVLQRRFRSRRLRQGLNVRFFPFGVVRPNLTWLCEFTNLIYYLSI
jgi:hypothetical protein